MNVHIHSEPLLTVSSETGEVTSLVLTDGDVVRKKDDIPQAQSINRGRNFVKMFPDTADELCKRLSGAGLMMCFSILPYIARDSGILKKRNGAFVTRQYLCERIGDNTDKGTRTIDRGLSELLREGILAKSTVKGRVAYIANPYVFQNGVKANPTLLSLFDKSGWKKGGW